MPAWRKKLGFQASFTRAETELLLRGWVPDPVVDWWFICVEDGWLNFHRSDTGFCIYALRLEYGAHGSTVAASRLNADPRQYATRDIDYDRKLLGYLINALLLEKRDTPFPMPADAGDATPDEVRYAYVRRGLGAEPVYPLDPWFSPITKRVGVVAVLIVLCAMLALLTLSVLEIIPIRIGWEAPVIVLWLMLAISTLIRDMWRALEHALSFFGLRDSDDRK